MRLTLKRCTTTLNRLRLPLTIAMATVAQGTWAIEPAPAITSASTFATSTTDEANVRSRYIVRFEENPLARHRGIVSMKKSRSTAYGREGRAKLDANGVEARAYVSFLKQRQQEHFAQATVTLKREVAPLATWQRAVNGALVEISEAEARLLRAQPGVLSVNREKYREPETDTSPVFTGASALWQNDDSQVDPAERIFQSVFESYSGFLGDGVVIAILDSGYNSLSPSFAAIDDTGYAIQNPLGTGHFRGHCAVPGIARGACNDKVISVFDGISVGAGNGAVTVEDETSHGSHTGGTAAGNGVNVRLANGYAARISGQAPHANLMVYRVCTATTCPESGTIASVEDVIDSEQVDVIGYSVSSDKNPWGDDVADAFLSATEAGIIVAAAAGNVKAGALIPLPGSVKNQAPWVLTVQNGSHGKGDFVNQLRLSGDGAPRLEMEHVSTTAPLAEALNERPIVVSPEYSIDPDGCDAYPAGTFQGSIALVKRATSAACSSRQQVQNAMDAGAVSVIFASRNTQTFASNANQQIPVFVAKGTNADPVAAYLIAHPATTATIPNALARGTEIADSLASTALLGPAAYDLIKPDIQAPGLHILAPFRNDGTPNGANAVALMSGTSMATPHAAGAAALLAGIHRDWTPMEIKSALMTTALTTGLTTVGGAAPSTPFDRGSGRMRVDVANRAGLVLNETAARFRAADPTAQPPGDPSTLNLASLQKARCFSREALSCTFERTVRSTAGQAVRWNAALSGVAGSVQPADFTVAGGATQSISVTVETAGMAADGRYQFGEMVLTPDNNGPVLHFPIAVSVPPPTLVAPPSIDIVIPAGSISANVMPEFRNAGGATLNITNTNYRGIEPAPVALIEKPTAETGYTSSYFTDSQTGRYAAARFTVPTAGTTLSQISTAGFMSSATRLASLNGNNVHIRIYRNQGDLPDGAPANQVVPNNPPFWTYTGQIGAAAGLSVANDDIALDLTVAGAPAAPVFAAGDYWLAVYPEVNQALNGRWNWNISNGGQSAAVNGQVAWAPDPDGRAMTIKARVSCGGDWLMANPGAMPLPRTQEALIQVSAGGNLPGGNRAVGYLCIESNDPARPIHPIPVTVTRQ